jgi:hypothetical protein
LRELNGVQKGSVVAADGVNALEFDDVTAGRHGKCRRCVSEIGAAGRVECCDHGTVDKHLEVLIVELLGSLTIRSALGGRES